MSYARWGCDGSDVYVYGTQVYCVDFRRVEEAWVCQHVDDEGSFSCKTIAAMLAHLREHVARGDCVPDYTFERLDEESKEPSRGWEQFKVHAILDRVPDVPPIPPDEPWPPREGKP